MCADIAVRPLPADRFVDFDSVITAAFGTHPDPAKAAVVASVLPEDRRLVAWDGDRPVGTAAAFSFELTVPGGVTVPTAGVTGVGVLATHRRRGTLRQLMAAQLDDVAGRGEPLAILTASESGIYRRFGYGIGSLNARYELESRRIEFREPVGADLDLRLVRGEEATASASAIYDRWRTGRPGAVAFTAAWWKAVLGSQENYIGGGDVFVVLCEPQGDHEGGFAVYATPYQPSGLFDINVRMLVANDPVVEARLWRYLCEIDLSEHVRVDLVPVDCPLRWWVTDPRQVRTIVLRDWLHVRVLDVPAALSARRYAADGEVVIEVTDPFRPTAATDGRFVLTVRDGEGTCGTTTAPPDLEFDIAALGSMYLGGVRATDLAAAGLVTQRTPGALARAESLLGWPVAPFGPTNF